jgi:putative methyltransferase
VVDYLLKEGWTLVPTPETYEEFLESVKELESDHFIKDFHLPDVLVFQAGTEFYKHQFYKNGTFILQDKVRVVTKHFNELI